MENFNELQALINERNKIENYIKHAKSIGLYGRYSSYEVITFLDSDNNRYNFDGLSKIIGEEKLKALVSQFEGLVTVELQRAKENKEKEVAQFSVIKFVD